MIMRTKVSAAGWSIKPLLLFLVATACVAAFWALRFFSGGPQEPDVITPGSGVGVLELPDVPTEVPVSDAEWRAPAVEESDEMSEGEILTAYEKEFSADFIIARLKKGNELIEETGEYALFTVQDFSAGTAGQINDLVADILLDAPDRADLIGLRLLTEARHPSLRVTGAALMAAGKGLTQEQCAALAADPDVNVPLLLMSVLESQGRWSLAREISVRTGALYTAAELWSLADNHEISPEIRSRALALLSADAAPESVGRIQNLAMNPSNGIELRLAALAELGRRKPDDFYRLAASAAQAGDARWKSAAHDVVIWHDLAAGVTPDELHTEEINAVLDGEHRDALFILATLLRSAVGDQAESIHPETREYLYHTLDGFRNQPLSGEQRYWLQVLEGFCKNDGMPPEPSGRENSFF